MMKFLDLIVLLALFALLFTGVYFLWQNLPTESENFEEYYANVTKGLDLPSNSVQFYANMRYAEKNIGYKVSEGCSTKKKNDFESAVRLLESLTILEFQESSSPEITITCSNIAPEPSEEDHFVAGEGGPSSIINSSKYAIILSGKIALYRPETCDAPQIATHELLHALGFDHNNNSNSIMYPFTDCDQTVDQNIIDEINRIYSEPSLADLVIESVVANKTGSYINFEITVSNQGLKKVTTSTLNVIAESLTETFDLTEIDLGAKRKLTVQNLKIPRNTNKVTFIVTTNSEEISTKNNEVEINLIQTVE